MTWTITPEPPDSPTATALWRAYYTEVSDRYYLLHEGRRTAPDELEREIAAHTGDDLRLPKGQLLVARHNDTPAGSAGVRLLAPETAELTRVFIHKPMRGKGGAPLLIQTAEHTPRTLGAPRIILDTRHDLTEARALYTKLGYEETPPHNNDPYAEHWFTKPLH
ncbi:GNAT family N-acetyltransferase [Streptomyces viridochromogenes]|uniref:GNAT family N-acetyltransferase n=1 Tax=Streptomyces viridochromogenes TaxID=1938 RepID=UPI0018FE0601|nr:GNAT family N-acetyltransferase [Streptomyces viridochromogenes]